MSNKTKTKTVNTEIHENDNDTIVENKKTKETLSTPQKKIKKEFKDSDYILCRSIWSGGLTVTCKSGSVYEFNRYGAECDIEYRDLIYLTRKNSDHIFTPRFIILDEDYLEEFPQIKRLYSTMYTPTELHTIVDLPIPQMKMEIEKLPDETKSTLMSLVATDIAKGRIDSIKKVKALSEIFNSDFNLLNELFNN